MHTMKVIPAAAASKIAADAAFGGTVTNDAVAKGIVEAMGRVDLRAPIVIRLDGTNAEEGREILKNAGIPESKLTSKPTMLEAAEAAVALAK